LEINAILAPSADDVVAFGNFLKKQWNVGGIVLQVAVHGDNVFAAGVVESGGQAGSLSEIAAQLDYGYATVDGGYLAEQPECAVDGAVIDQHHFEGLAASFHYGFEARVEVGDILLFVMERHYD